YEEHLRRIESALPPTLQELAWGRAADGACLSLHDALLRRIAVDDARQVVDVECTNGDLQLGYGDLRLTNGHAKLDGISSVQATRLAERRSEILYDEVDVVEDGAFVHRLLTLENIEAAIVFRTLDWRRVPRDQRH